MPKQNSISPEKFAQHVHELSTLWKENKVNEFSQNIVALRWRFNKALVNQLLNQVREVLTKKEESVPHVPSLEFKLFENGEEVEAIQNIRSGRSNDDLIAAKGEKAVVIDNNRLNSNRYITVQFEGKHYNVVAHAAKFKRVRTLKSAPIL